MKVFVVEDEPSLRSLLQELTEATPALEWSGAADSAEEALAGGSVAHADVVVMDYRLPGIDGVTATARLRAAHPDLDVVGWTGVTDPSVHHAFLAAGAFAVLLKGSPMELIRELVRRAERSPGGPERPTPPRRRGRFARPGAADPSHARPPRRP